MIFQIDAFSKKLFGGNPAAVIPLKSWLNDIVMQEIAAENNLSETAFFVRTGERIEIRWFTPTQEVDLCGHATLATAYLIFTKLKWHKPEILFDSKSGELGVKQEGNKIVLNFPNEKPIACKTPIGLQEALGINILSCAKGVDYIVEVENEEAIQNCTPDLNALAKFETRGICITAKGNTVDFVSRFFAPRYGINEDPVTGSAHTQLVPFWAEKLEQTKFHAKQISMRGGELWCELLDDRVSISGEAVRYLEGAIEV